MYIKRPAKIHCDFGLYVCIITVFSHTYRSQGICLTGHGSVTDITILVVRDKTLCLIQ